MRLDKPRQDGVQAAQGLSASIEDTVMAVEPYSAPRTARSDGSSLSQESQEARGEARILTRHPRAGHRSTHALEQPKPMRAPGSQLSMVGLPRMLSVPGVANGYHTGKVVVQWYAGCRCNCCQKVCSPMCALPEENPEMQLFWCVICPKEIWDSQAADRGSTWSPT